MSTRRILAFLACLPLAGGCSREGPLEPDAAAGIARMQIPQNLVVAAVGLDTQPARLDFHVPAASGADVTSARLRWTGRGTNPAGDPAIIVNSHQRTATLIATENVGGEAPWLFVYEWDATSLVHHGNNTLYMSGFDLGAPMRLDGAVVIVTYNDPASPWTAIHFVDPAEYVRDGTGAVWELPIGYSGDARQARFVVAAGDCEAALADRIWWSAGSGPAPGWLAGTAANVYEDRLTAGNGDWMDVLDESIAIPAGAAHFAYQTESPAGGTGDSIVHLLGVLCIDGEPTTCAASISGHVWNDEDRDGSRGEGEPGLSAVTVSLEDMNGDVVATSTDSSGAFSFEALCAGDCVLTIDESTLPPDWEPTTCDGGACSPLPVNLDADDAAVSGLAFGWAAPPPPPPPPADVCFRGPAYWQRQFICMRGHRGHGKHRGHEHVDRAALTALLAVVEAESSIDWTRGDGRLDPKDALRILKSRHRGRCAQANRHWFTALLNWAYNGARPDLAVDTDRDGVVDSTMAEVIAEIEPLLAYGNGSSCRAAKYLAMSVNATPSMNCGP